ncbi:MAG: DMT family transporter [Methylobacteriaceae bacterium]|nr:DMT family transporter [Methylobacteriaceae bacterium]
MTAETQTGRLRAFFTNRPIVCVLAGLCCIAWGGPYPGIKRGYELLAVGPDDITRQLLFAGYRFFIAGIVLLALVLVIHPKAFNIGRRAVGQLFILGLTQTTLQYVFFYWGMANTSGSRGAVMNGTSTFFAVLLAHFLYRNERLDFRRAAGCLIGFAGVMLVNIDDRFQIGFSPLGDGNVILAAFIFSAASIYGKELSRHMDAMFMAGAQLTVGGFLLLLPGYCSGVPLGRVTPEVAVVFAILIAISSFGFALWSVLLKYNEVGLISVFSFLTPVAGAVFSALYLGDSIGNWRFLAALVMVSAGIILVAKRKVAKAPAK